jgi:hypothetical protein
MDQEKKRNYMRWPALITILSGLVLSLMLLVVAQNLDPQRVQPVWLKSLLEQIASTIMVAATVGLLFEWLTRKEIMTMMDETRKSISAQVRTLRSLEELGLVDAYLDASTYSYHDLILSSHELTVVLNDGRSWVGRNVEHLRTRLLIPNYRTTFVFQHPESEMLEEVLSKKCAQPADFLRQKILDTIRELRSIEKAEGHDLKIMGHFFFNVHSLFITEEYLIMTPYYISPGRNTVAAYFFEKRGQSSQYQRIYNDIQQLIRVSTSLEPA